MPGFRKSMFSVYTPGSTMESIKFALLSMILKLAEASLFQQAK
jgi:hypothetical protein